jgi:hypothetical protein
MHSRPFWRRERGRRDERSPTAQRNNVGFLGMSEGPQLARSGPAPKTQRSVVSIADNVL